MFTQVSRLRCDFFCRFCRNFTRSPDLAVGMGVGTAHCLAFVFENLYIMDKVICADFSSLIAPGLYHGLGLKQRKFWQAEIVAWGEADYSANSGYRLGSK